MQDVPRRGGAGRTESMPTTWSDRTTPSVYDCDESRETLHVLRCRGRIPGRPVGNGLPQRCGRRLTEHLLVGSRKPSKLEEAVFCRNPGHRGLTGETTGERAACFAKPPILQPPFRPGAADLI